MNLDDIQGRVLRRGDGYPASYQTAVRTEPDLVVEAADAQDVRRAVAHAAANDLPVAARATGHGATSLTAGVLISTTRLRHVRIDADALLAEVGAGATWGDVVREAARSGLAPLNGSAPTVGVTGFSLGGGIGPLTRRYGYAADHVTALDVVTADGQSRHVSADHHPDLFWALRGGGGGLAVVTALRFRLFPVDRVLAGALTFDPDRFPELVERYRDWTADLPDELTSSLSFMTFPDLPALPAHLRGHRSLRLVVTCTDPRRAASALDAPRTWDTTEDTLRPMPYPRCAEVFAERPQPHGYQGDAVTTPALDPAAATSALDLINADTHNCTFLQLHHLGGAAARPADHDNSIGYRDAAYLVRVTTPILEPAPTGLAGAQGTLIENLAHGSTSRALNFLFGDNTTEHPARTCYDNDTYQRLLHIKRHHDPANLIRLQRAL